MIAGLPKDIPFHHPKFGELIAYDPERKRGMYAKWNFETASEDLTTITSVDDTLAENHFSRMESQNQKAYGIKNESGFGRRIASVPMALLYNEKLDLNKAFQEDDKYFDRWLNDGDNRAFRTNESKV